MTSHRKRRWFLATVAVVVVGLAVGLVVVFVSARRRPKDLGKLTVIKQGVVGSNYVVRFRYERSDKSLTFLSPLVLDGTATNLGFPLQEVDAGPWDVSGKACEFSYAIASSNMQVRCRARLIVLQEASFLRSLVGSVKACLRDRTVDVKANWVTLQEVGSVTSDLITNAVPRATNSPAK